MNKSLSLFAALLITVFAFNVGCASWHSQNGMTDEKHGKAYPAKSPQFVQDAVKEVESLDFINSTVLYVDASIGKDSNFGLGVLAPKKTIQAAIDMLPARIKHDVTIRVAEGVYREMVTISGVHVDEPYKLRIVGDESWSPASGRNPKVRVTGADTDENPKPLRSKGISIFDSANIEVVGFYGNYARWNQFVAHASPGVIFRKCKGTGVSDNDAAFAFDACYAGGISECLASNSGYTGIYIGCGATVGITDGTISTGNNMGLHGDRNSNVGFGGNVSFSENRGDGVVISTQSNLISGSSKVKVDQNGGVGLRVSTGGVVIKGDSTWTLDGNAQGAKSLNLGGAEY